MSKTGKAECVSMNLVHVTLALSTLCLLAAVAVAGYFVHMRMTNQEKNYQGLQDLIAEHTRRIEALEEEVCLCRKLRGNASWHEGFCLQ